MSEPLLTAIVSTYNAERFMRGCLDDLVAQTMLEQMDILVIDSGSLENERAICEEYMSRYPQIRYLRTDREPLYVAWNRAIGMAKGKYLTSANTDDRHHPDFAKTLVGRLEENSDVALAYADQLVSHTENETFAECEQREARRRRWPEFTHADLLLRCITGSQPVWRKSVHADLGLFDTRYKIVADYEMWLRMATTHCLARIPTPLGVFFDSPNTISGSGNQVQVNLETMAVQKTYVEHAMWRDIPQMRKRLAAEIFGRGYQHIERDGNSRAALPLIREAIRLHPSNLRFIKTYAIRQLASLRSS